MALYTKSGNVVPSDAVVLTEEDAVHFQWNMVNSWKHTQDVFFLKYGGQIMSVFGGAMGLYINSYYRFRLRLMHYGRYSTYLPVVVIPVIVTASLHYKGVQRPILIDKYQCPICLEIKAVITQFIGGVCYPLALAPLTSFMMASKYNTYNVPPITKDPKSVFNLYKKLTKPMVNTFLGLSIFQLVIVAFVAYKEIDSIETIKRKLMAFEAEMDNLI